MFRFRHGVMTLLGAGSALSFFSCSSPPPPPPSHIQTYSDIAREPLPKSAVILNALSEEEAKRQLARGVGSEQGEPQVNLLTACISLEQQPSGWLPIQAGTLPKDDYTESTINEVYADIVESAMKGGVSASLFEFEGFSAKAAAEGSDVGGFFYRLTLTRQYQLNPRSKMKQSAMVDGASGCPDESCGTDFVEKVLCGELLLKTVKRTAFDAGVGVKVEAWNLEVGVDLATGYTGSSSVKKEGCFVAVPVPYRRLKEGNFCSTVYQDGLSRGEKCAERKWCYEACEAVVEEEIEQRPIPGGKSATYMKALERGYRRAAGKDLTKKCQKDTSQSQSQSQRQY